MKTNIMDVINVIVCNLKECSAVLFLRIDPEARKEIAATENDLAS